MEHHMLSIGTKDSQSGENNSLSSKMGSKEKVTVLSSHTDLQFDDNQVKYVLLDFEKLDFENNPCNDAWDVINYNEGKEADPFDKIAKYYGRKKNVILFVDVVRQKEKNILDIISKKCDAHATEKFTSRLKIYLDRIGHGTNDAREFLNADLTAFFHGYHVACPGHNRNIHENLNINITEPEQTLETSNFFIKKTERIEEEKSEVKRAKIYSNGKRVVTINKNEEQQRNYSFTKFAKCDIEINWDARDESGKEVNCAVVLKVNSGQIDIGKSTAGGENVGPKEILELAKQNEIALVRGKTLHTLLEECLLQQPQHEKENMQPREDVVIGDEEMMIDKGAPSPQQGSANN